MNISGPALTAYLHTYKLSLPNCHFCLVTKLSLPICHFCLVTKLSLPKCQLPNCWLPNCHFYLVTKLSLPNCQLPNCQLPNCQLPNWLTKNPPVMHLYHLFLSLFFSLCPAGLRPTCIANYVLELTHILLVPRWW